MILLIADRVDNILNYACVNEALEKRADSLAFNELYSGRAQLIKYKVIIVFIDEINEKVLSTLDFISLFSDTTIILAMNKTDDKNIIKNDSFLYVSQHQSTEHFTGIIKAIEMKDAQTFHNQWQSLSTLKTAQFELSKVQQVPSLARIIAMATNKKEPLCIGVFELLVNAFEHGVYNIGFETKKQLMHEKKYIQELKKRNDSIEFNGKMVKVFYHKKEEGIFIKIDDPGYGFDPEPYMAFDKSRAKLPNGRGIAYARQHCFDKLIYKNNGSSVSSWLSF